MMRIKLSTLQKIITEALENAYDVLGLQPGASKKDILAAWRRLVYDARSTRGGGRGGQEGTLINYYGKAVRAALANLKDPNVDPTFEPRVPRIPKELTTGWDAETAAADLAGGNAELAGGSIASGTEDPSFDVVGTKLARTGRKPKASYKVYKGKAGNAGRSVIKIGNQLYASGPQTAFEPNSRADVFFDPDEDGRNVKVSKPGEDYSQTWDPVDEVRKVIDELIIESLYRESVL